MYECFHCGHKTVIWDWDFESGDYGYEEGGIVHEYHCENCGALITYAILPDETEEELPEEDPDQITMDQVYFDKEETRLNCAVQILTNTETGETSVGWREMTRKEKLTEAFRTMNDERAWNFSSEDNTESDLSPDKRPFPD